MTSPSPETPRASSSPVVHRQRRRQRRRWLVLGLALALSPLAMELAVRAAGQEGLVMHREVGKRIRKAAPPLGYVLRPNARIEVTFAPRNGPPIRTAVMTINSLGLRGDLPRGGSPLIACIGDSHTFGYGVNDDETWPVILEKTLHADRSASESSLASAPDAPSLEVLNFGVGGYGPTKELIRMERDALPYRPDIVVWQWFMNDFQTRSSWRPKSRLRRIIEPWTSPFRADWVMAVREKSVLADLSLHALYGWCREQPDSVKQLALATAKSEGWRTTQTELLAARDAAEATGAKFVILLHPMMFESSGAFQSAPLDALMRSFCERQSIPLIDLRESLSATDAAQLRNSDLDYHANARCHRIVGQAVARVLLGWGWLG